MAKFVDYIDRQRLIEELTAMQLDLYECNASEDAIVGFSVARRITQRFPSADVPEAETASVPKWTPVLLKSMPPENEEGVSDNLILKTVVDGRTLILVGFTQCGKWYSAMAGNSDVLGDEFKVTHWMYMTDLAEVVGNG